MSVKEVILGQQRYRVFQYFRFQQGAYGKKFFHIVGRQFGDNGSSIRNNRDQPFGVQLPERLANRDAADVVLIRDQILAELSAFLDFSPDDLIAKSIGDGGGQ